MHHLGVDIIEIWRVERAISRQGERFLKRIYTDNELILCQGKIPPLAVRFAGKEAVMKVLGTGIKEASWKEIEILPDHRGAPLVGLSGRAEKRAAELGLNEIVISLSHSREYAVASALGTENVPCVHGSEIAISRDL